MVKGVETTNMVSAKLRIIFWAMSLDRGLGMLTGCYIM
jgi:hypothetical protein